MESDLYTEIDRTALAGVVGGGEDGEGGTDQWHMFIGIGVGLAAYVVDRLERKKVAAEASTLLNKLHGHFPTRTQP